MLTLKSQEQKTFTARFPVDLRTRKLLPKDVDMLQENNVAIKYTLQKGLKENDSLIVQPVHQDDADNEEGDGGGKEIGRRYTVWHYLRLVSITDSQVRCFSIGAVAQVSTSTCVDDGVAVVAVKHHTLRKVTLPEITDGADTWFKGEIIMPVLLLM